MVGLSFRRSVRIGKHTRLNFSKSGIGISTGVKGARVSVGPHGVRKTLSIPGTGIRYTKQGSWKNGNAKKARVNPVYSDIGLKSEQSTQLPDIILLGNKKYKTKSLKRISNFLIWVDAFTILLSFLIMPFGIVTLIIGIIGFCAGMNYRKKIKDSENQNAPGAEAVPIDGSVSLVPPAAPKTVQQESGSPIPRIKTSVKNVNTKIVGVSYGNRQQYLEDCYDGQDLLVRNKPSAKYPKAMAVYTLKDDDNPNDIDNPRKVEDMLGYLGDDLAQSVFDELKPYCDIIGTKIECDAEIEEMTGGTEEKPTRGCNILLYIPMIE